MVSAIKHSVPHWVKLWFVIFPSRHSGAQPWASVCPDVKNYGNSGLQWDILQHCVTCVMPWYDCEWQAVTRMDELTEPDVNRPSPVTAALLSQLPAPPQADMDTDVPVSYGSQDWHSALPTVRGFLCLSVTTESSSCLPLTSGLPSWIGHWRLLVLVSSFSGYMC